MESLIDILLKSLPEGYPDQDGKAGARNRTLRRLRTLKWRRFSPAVRPVASSLVWLLLLCLGGALGSCGTVSPVRSQPQSTPKESPSPPAAKPSSDSDAVANEIIELKPALDTLLVRGIQPQVEAMPGRGVYEETPSSCNIVVLMPFLTGQWNGNNSGLSSVSRWSLHFLAGAKMALESLPKKGPDVSLTVLDTKGSEKEVAELLKTNSSLANAQLIIGPYRRSNIQLVAEFVKNRDVLQVSPYSAASGLTRQNPHYIQVRPSLETHCRALLQHALQSYRPQQITLISGKGDAMGQHAVETMQEAYFTWAGTRSVSPLLAKTVDGQSLNGGSLAPLLSGRDTAVFLFAAWQFEDERLVYAFLRNLDLARRQGQHIVVYGTPVWGDFDRVDLDYFEKFNVHISNYSYLDKSNPDIAEFRRDYYDRYGALPTEEAFLGYDVLSYFVPLAQSYGTALVQHLEGNESEQLHTRFAFERVASGGSAETDPPIEQFENKFVHILRFSDYRFQPANYR